MRRFLLFVALAVCSLVFHTCRFVTQEKKFRIGFSQCCNDAWRHVMEREMLQELSFHQDLRFEMKVADSDSRRQVEQIRELVASGIDLLIVAPNESQPLTAVVEEVYQSGIPVVLIDRRTESEQYTAYIGADNRNIGKTAAEYIAARLGGKARIVELKMQMTISPAIERHQGFMEGVEQFPGLKIAGSYEIIRIEEEMDRFAKCIQAHPEANVIFGQTDLLAETAYKIARSQGRADSLFFVGIDGIPGTGQGIEAVEQGILDASLLYPTGGSEAIRLALTILHGLPFQKKNLLETTVIDQDNARILHAQMNKQASLQENIDRQIKNLNDITSTYRSQRVFIFILISSLLLTVVLGAFLWRSLKAKQAALKSLEEKNREVLSHQQQIVEMSEEVRKATQAKVDFFTHISHEFRTPLTLIIGFAEDLLPSAKVSAELHQSMRMIRQNAFRLLRLVNQLMDFRKIESEKMRLRAAETDLVAFVRDVMKSYVKTAEKRNISFQLKTREEQIPVWIDVDMMDKILFNLLSNAFKFTPDGGKIDLSISSDAFNNTVYLAVEDNGKGMTETEAQHAFEPFFQGDHHMGGGTGLGLSLSKSLIELHGGALALHTLPHKGSRFTLSLPLGKKHLHSDQIDADPVMPLHDSEAEYAFIEPLDDLPVEGNQAPESQHILIIEDNADLQSFLRKRLSAGYQLEKALDGLAGIQKAFDTIPDLVICDMMLPGASGLEVTRRLKSDLRTSHIPIILLTARSAIEQQIEGEKAGADAYITKPFNISFLQEKIRNLLHNRRILKDAYGKDMIVFHQQPAGSLHALDAAFLQKFTAYIQDNYARQDFQVEDLCREMNLSRSQLYRKVKALLGESISDYIQNTRLKKAQTLLMEGRLTVAEIAYQVGYSSPDYFSTVFRSKYNTSPSHYRRGTTDDDN